MSVPSPNQPSIFYVPVVHLGFRASAHFIFHVNFLGPLPRGYVSSAHLPPFALIAPTRLVLTLWIMLFPRYSATAGACVDSEPEAAGCLLLIPSSDLPV